MNRTIRIISACDSFKGSLSSREANLYVKSGVESVFPSAQVRCITIGDGGEGTMEAITDATHATAVTCPAHDALMRPVDARYAVSADGRTAIIEMAQAAGLTMLDHNERNPLYTTTYGVGDMIADALARGCRCLVVGLGGSATNDGGAGMLAALGFRFADTAGNTIAVPVGADLSRIDSVIPPPPGKLPEGLEFILACDVTSPFAGPAGAAKVFSPQKGASPAVVEQLEEGMRHLAEVYAAASGRDISATAGAGAAGGLAGGFIAMLGATVRSGIDLVLDLAGFDAAVADADLVITGEGRLDTQTAMGKAPWGIMRRASAAGVPTVAIGGSVEDPGSIVGAGFLAAVPVVQGPVSLHTAMQTAVAADNVHNTAAMICRLFFRDV